MKTYLFALVMLVLISSCDDENPQPVSEFAGNYSLSSTDPAIEIGFKVSDDGQIHNFDNAVYVKHTAIPESQQTNNNIKCFDKFENGNGYGRIEISSRGTSFYRITLIYNEFIDGGLSVYDVQIDISGQPFMILPDQILTRNQ